jgi:quercetin dioxygenase-like cupin family protein
VKFLFSLLALAAVQAAAPPVAIENEPYHHLLFANSTVKVLDVELPSGAQMAFHTHPTDHLAIVIAGGRLRNDILGRPPLEHFTGLPGSVVFIPAGPPHRQANIDDHAARWIAVELVGKPAPSTHSAVSSPYEVVLDNDVVEAAQVSLAPGARLAAPPFGLPHLRIAITAADLESRADTGETVRSHFAAGTAAWVTADPPIQVNVGAGPVEFVYLRVK